MNAILEYKNTVALSLFSACIWKSPLPDNQPFTKQSVYAFRCVGVRQVGGVKLKAY